MIIDSHTHAGTSWFEPVETLIHQMDANGVQKAVLIQHGGMYDNSYLLDCAARHNGRFSVVGMVDEASPTAPDELAGWAERGVTGVRLTPSSPESLWKAASEIGLTVSCRQEVDAFASGQFADLVAGLPEGGMLEPDAIAETYYALHCQDRSAWTLEVDVRPWCERF